MKRIALLVLLALGALAPPVQAHYLDYNSVRNHIRATNIEGWCGKGTTWICSGQNYMTVAGASWDHDGTAIEGSHSREWRASWLQHNLVSSKRCEMWFREYHYEFAERYRGPDCD